MYSFMHNTWHEVSSQYTSTVTITPNTILTFDVYFLDRNVFTVDTLVSIAVPSP